MERIGIGLIGASLGNWAATAHIPALLKSSDFELRRLATSRPESAAAAEAEFGVPTDDDYRAMLEDPAIEAVIVAVKVPTHVELVSAALAAGKDVVCEWPLAVDAAAAAALTAEAEARDARTAVTFQGRFRATVRYAADLVADGFVGRVMAVNYVGSGIGWVPDPPPSYRYVFAAGNGVSVLSVTGGHALDTIAEIVGEPAELDSRLAIGHREVVLSGEDGGRETIDVSVPDQVAIAGRLESGAILSCFFRGGISRGVDLHWEINGTEGDLLFTAPDNGNLQNTELTLYGARGEDGQVRKLGVPESYRESPSPGLSGPPRVYARLYEALARDWRGETAERLVPDFAHAVERQRLIEGIEAGHWSNGGAS